MNKDRYQNNEHLPVLALLNSPLVLVRSKFRVRIINKLVLFSYNWYCPGPNVNFFFVIIDIAQLQVQIKNEQNLYIDLYCQLVNIYM